MSAPPSAPAVPGKPAPGGPAFALPFDPLRLVLAIIDRWWLVLVGGVVGGALAMAAGWWVFDTHYTATVQLLRRELPNSFRTSDLGESFKPRQFSAGTITAMMRAPSLLAKVGARATPRVSGGMLGAGLTITPERNTDLITVTLRGEASAAATATLLNSYVQEVVVLTKSLQSQEAAELNQFLVEQVAKTERELTAANQELLNFSREADFIGAEKEAEAFLRAVNEAELRLQTGRLERETVEFRIAAAQRELAHQDPLKLRLAEARDALEALRFRYTDANPLVAEQEAKVRMIEEQVRGATNATTEFHPGENSVANSLYLDLVNLQAQRLALESQQPQLEAYRTNLLARLRSVPEKGLRYARLKARQTSLETARDLLAARQREAALFVENAPGYYRVFAETTPEQVATSRRSKKVVMAGFAGGFAGLFLVLLGICGKEALDDRLLSPGDARRLAGVPLLGSLPDLDRLDPRALARWQFATWAALQRRFAPDGPGPMILGITSARSGEGRSTWIHLLQQAAAEREWRTLSVLDRVEPGFEAESAEFEEVLANPGSVREALDRSRHVVVRYDPGQPWTRDERAAWKAAVSVWQSLPRTVVLLELPPADRLEAVLLAGSMPTVLWLAASNQTRQGEVRAAMANLRLAETPLAGVLLNRAPARFERLPDLSRFGLGLALLLTALSPSLRAQPLPEPQQGSAGTPLPAASGVPGTARPASNGSLLAPGAVPGTGYLSATAAGPRLAPWQERLTLGPGDVLSFSVYGRKEFTRTEVPVGPDGRISYLQAHDVVASGLTVDELRDKLTAELGKFHRHVRVIVTPVAWRSKKYYLLGTIMDRGAFTLDRPLTIIEATARARGIATGLLEQNTVEIADLPRTFLIRQGRRLPVDFVKLFQEGDLSQNVALEPGDYIYFPSATVNEVYVLGSVSSPGTVGVTEKATVLSVITTRGGFAPQAYPQRILVVRGSLAQPETHVVNLGAVLSGKSLDFRVLPKDIIYVADRPWARVEELLDMAIKAFVVTATAEWVNKNVGPVITDVILPSP